MKTDSQSITLLVADDDADDRMLIKDAFVENRLANEVRFVEDGEELMDYLLNRGAYANKEKFSRPGLILLDLNMPKKDGRECLRDIKSHEELKNIPVVVLTTSKAEEDILRSYNLGVNSFVSKPVSFLDLVAITRDLSRYWFEIVELPPSPGKSK